MNNFLKTVNGVVNMGWFLKMFGIRAKEEIDSICLNMDLPHWEVQGPKTFSELFSALEGWLPLGSIMYFEGGSPDDEIEKFMKLHAISGKVNIASGTLWPRPMSFHIPATTLTIHELATIMDHHAEPELAIHFHIYKDKELLFQWYDAFSDPILINGDVSEEQIICFTGKIGRKFKKIEK